MTATITANGVLTVWGVEPLAVVVDEGAPAAARNALVNLLQQHAAALEAPVRAAVRTPAGPWYMAVDADGRCVPLDPAMFTQELPELDQATMLAGIEAVLAAATTPQATLALASDPDQAIRSRAVAELATWSDDQDVVAQAQLPPYRLEVLARCDLAWVRAGVAANPRTGPDALAGLVDDQDPTVRMALAARFDLDPAVTVQLAGDVDQRVRAELARNPAATFLTNAVEGDSAEDEAAAAPPEDPEARLSVDDESHDDQPDPDTGGRRMRRRALGATVAAVVVGALAVAGYAAATSSSTPPPAPASASPAASTVQWNGIVLPSGPDGPDDPAGPVAAGFARTELGAAMAAAHLSVRIDPYAGPDSFTETITRQTSGGDPEALLAATRARYDTAAAQSGITDGGPIPTSPARIAGWRTGGDWNPDAPTSVHLRVTASGGATDYAIAVVWVDGDYALLDPTGPGTFTTGPAGPASDYRSF